MDVLSPGKCLNCVCKPWTCTEYEEKKKIVVHYEQNPPKQGCLFYKQAKS